MGGRGGGGGGGMREFRLCKVNCGVVTGSKELPSSMVFLVTFLVKGVDIFDEVVAVCGFSDNM